MQFGPGIFGLLTQVMGVAAIFYMFAGGGSTYGLIRNISAASSAEERRRWMCAGTAINCLSSLALAAIAIALALLGGGLIFDDPSYGLVYIGIAVAQVVVGVGNLVLAYFSGIGDNRTFAVVNISGNILSLLLVIALAQGLGLVGTVFGLVLAPAMVGIVALLQFFRNGGDLAMFRIAWEPSLLKNLFSYSTAMACAVTAVPLAQLLIRIDMSLRLGWNFVGYWQTVAKLSDAYMLFVGVVFINYLLPQLSRRRGAADALRVLVHFGAPMLGMFVLACIAIYLARDYLILMIYSPAFLPAADLVPPQLVGDSLRVAALLLHYYFMSRGQILIVVASELTQGITLYILYLVLVPSYAAMAPVYGHVATYALLLALMLGFLCIAKRRASGLAS